MWYWVCVVSFQLIKANDSKRKDTVLCQWHIFILLCHKPVWPHDAFRCLCKTRNLHLWHWGSTVTQSYEETEFSCSSWRQHRLGKVPTFYFHFDISSQSETELLMSRVLPGETVCSLTPAEGKRADSPPAGHHRRYHLRGFMRRPLTPEHSVSLYCCCFLSPETSPCSLHLCLSSNNERHEEKRKHGLRGTRRDLIQTSSGAKFVMITALNKS